MGIAQKNFEFVCEIVEQQAAIVLGKEKQYLVESRLFPIAKHAGFKHVDAMVDSLRVMPNSPVLKSVIDAITTNETSFFRDTVPFRILGETVFPELLEKRQLFKTIRIWSAACSSGQEPYSIAILWRDKFPNMTDWQVKILATDISSEMVLRAREGKFAELEMQRGLTDKQRRDHFVENGRAWTVRPELRSTIEFKEMNLIRPFPTGMKVDVIFLRNVLVYFNNESKKDILGRIRQLLAPDGYLFLGGAETTVMIDDGFERVASGGGSYYRLRS